MPPAGTRKTAMGRLSRGLSLFASFGIAWLVVGRFLARRWGAPEPERATDRPAPYPLASLDALHSLDPLHSMVEAVAEARAPMVAAPASLTADPTPPTYLAPFHGRTATGGSRPPSGAEDVAPVGRDDEGRRRDARGRGGSRRAVMLVGLLGVLWFAFGAAGTPFQGKLASVQKNDNSAYLPASAESTKVADELSAFSPVQVLPGFVVYQRLTGLTGGDRRWIDGNASAFRGVPGVAGDQVGAPQISRDGTTASIAVPLIAVQNNVNTEGATFVSVEDAILGVARHGAPPGLVIHSAGTGGLLSALVSAFSGLDGTLLLAAGAVVIAILLAVYRSPVLWFFPLFSSILALGAAALIIYELALHNVLTLNGQSQGILSVLVLGACTDYALLLVSRYREELHRYERRVDAMARAWRSCAGAIAASATTVVLGLLCLEFGQLNSDRSLGPVCAIGIACTVGVMLTFLPLFLTVVPRAVFWPRIPQPDGEGDLATHGAWSRLARAVGRRDRACWVATGLALVVCALGVAGLRTGGLSGTDVFTNSPDAAVGQRIYDEHFPADAGSPAVIAVNAGAVPAVIRAVRGLPGVAQGSGAVCIEPNYATVARALASPRAGAVEQAMAAGCLPRSYQLTPVAGRLLVDVTLAARYDSPVAYAAVERIRAAVHPLPGAGALVGGPSATNLDTQNASRHDRNLIIPLVLLVILAVLMVLLRALVAPVLLILTVVLSFTASLGVSALVFNHVFHYANADPAFPLFAFVFLVALGVDYNIFLMTRVHEEALARGTRPGVLRGLAVTGGVITSAGVVLAATFAVLGVLPLTSLAEVGFTVAFGVLLDTIVVRSLLVPALVHDIGPRVWWPSALAGTEA